MYFLSEYVFSHILCTISYHVFTFFPIFERFCMSRLLFHRVGEAHGEVFLPRITVKHSTPEILAAIPAPVLLCK